MNEIVKYIRSRFHLFDSHEPKSPYDIQGEGLTVQDALNDLYEKLNRFGKFSMVRPNVNEILIAVDSIPEYKVQLYSLRTSHRETYVTKVEKLSDS